jgi:hypothetical protein
VLPLIVLAACSKDSSSETNDKAPEPSRKLSGVYPEKFQCESVTSLAALDQALGGKAQVVDNPMTPPKGVMHPCNYQIDIAGQFEYWTWDADCRDGYKQRADALFAQYTNDSAAMVQQYNAVADAGIKPTDAGYVMHAPTGATEVQVGAKGLDHHGQGLIFVDDDAPCYVRVVGPDAGRRLELAKLVAKNLTFDNAPMTPRPMR